MDSDRTTLVGDNPAFDQPELEAPEMQQAAQAQATVTPPASQLSDKPPDYTPYYQQTPAGNPGLQQYGSNGVAPNPGLQQYGYGAAPNPSLQQQYGMPQHITVVAACPPRASNYCVLNWVACGLFCFSCFPLALIGLYFSNETNECNDRGDVAAAQKNSKRAKNFGIAAFATGITILVVWWIVFYITQITIH